MRLIKRAALVAAGLGMLCGSASADELKFANFMSPNHPYVAGAFQPLADRIGELTGGKVTVKLFSGGELGPGPVEQYNRVVDGVADLAIGLPGYTASKFPLTLLSELPGVLDEATGTATLWNNIDLFLPEYKRVKLVSLWSNAENLLYMRDKPVRSPADLAGLKIRVPSRNAGLIVTAWGATPVSMPVPQIYNAMQTGVIDGAMIDGTATRAFKLGEVSKYLTVGMNTTISPFFVVMSRDVYKSLGKDEQAAIDKAGREASDLGNKVQLTVAADGIEAFAAMEGRTLIRLGDAEAAAFNKLSATVLEPVISEHEAKGLPARAVIKALKAD